MFYDNFVTNCNKVNKSPSAVATELGLSRASVNGWKNGKIPTDANQRKIAGYFGITVEELMSPPQEKPLVNNDEELTDYLEELKNRKELRMLFSLTKGATKADVEKAVKIIETLLG